MPGVTPAEVLSNFGITLVEDPAENQPRLLVDLPAAELVEHAIRREEGRMASNGALVIETGERTGRSPNDRFIVDTPDVHDKIAWGAVNRRCLSRATRPSRPASSTISTSAMCLSRAAWRAPTATTRVACSSPASVPARRSLLSRCSPARLP